MSIDNDFIKIKIDDVLEKNIGQPEDSEGLLEFIDAYSGDYTGEKGISAIKTDINRSDYKFAFYDKEYDFNHKDLKNYKELYNLESKEQLVDELTLCDHQKKYLGILASQFLPLAMMNLKEEYRSFGSNHKCLYSIKIFGGKNSLNYDQHIKIDMQYSNKIPDNMLELDEAVGLESVQNSVSR
ncbi:hypothetical protein ACFFJN_14860 [Erwinia mallotivora]|uniref:hypothetical protein n=1 Tax=Erwinia mallotivora TaxID=69222 RepID=UPI0035EF14A5